MGFDIFFLVVLGIGLLRGLRKGFARQMLTISGVVLGLMFAETFCREATAFFGDNIQKLPIAKEVQFPILCFASLFVIWTLVVLVGSIYLKWYRTTVLFTIGPSAGDRLLGGALGVAKAGLVVGFFCLGYESTPGWIKNQSSLPAQREASKGFKLASEYPVADKLLETPEVLRFKDHFARILQHYRPGDKTEAADKLASKAQ